MTGNFSRVSRFIVAPSIQTKAKHKAKKKIATTKPPAKKKAPKLKLTARRTSPSPS